MEEKDKAKKHLIELPETMRKRMSGGEKRGVNEQWKVCHFVQSPACEWMIKADYI